MSETAVPDSGMMPVIQTVNGAGQEIQVGLSSALLNRGLIFVNVLDVQAGVEITVMLHPSVALLLAEQIIALVRQETSAGEGADR